MSQTARDNQEVNLRSGSRVPLHTGMFRKASESGAGVTQSFTIWQTSEVGHIKATTALSHTSHETLSHTYTLPACSSQFSLSLFLSLSLHPPEATTDGETEEQLSDSSGGLA